MSEEHKPQTEEEHEEARRKIEATKALFTQVGRGRVDIDEWEVDDRHCSHAPPGNVIGITRRITLSEGFCDNKLSIEAMHCVYYDNGEGFNASWSADGGIHSCNGMGVIPGEQDAKVIERAKALGIEMPPLYVKCASPEEAIGAYKTMVDIFDKLNGRIDVSDIKNPWIIEHGIVGVQPLTGPTALVYYSRFGTDSGLHVTQTQTPSVEYELPTCEDNPSAWKD